MSFAALTPEDAQLEAELDAIFGPSTRHSSFPPMSKPNTDTIPEAAAAALLPVVKIAPLDIVPDPKNQKGHDEAGKGAK